MEIPEYYMPDKSFSLNLICSKISCLEKHDFYRLTQGVV